MMPIGWAFSKARLKMQEHHVTFDLFPWQFHSNISLLSTPASNTYLCSLQNVKHLWHSPCGAIILKMLCTMPLRTVLQRPKTVLSSLNWYLFSKKGTYSSSLPPLHIVHGIYRERYIFEISKNPNFSNSSRIAGIIHSQTSNKNIEILNSKYM